MRFVTECKILILVLLPAAWLLGTYYVYEWQTARPASGSEIKQGTVIARDVTKVWYLAERPKLQIQVDDSPAIVHAILSMNADYEIPDRVTFHYSGDSGTEVYLLEEPNPLWFALFFLLAPVLGIMATTWLSRRS